MAFYSPQGEDSASTSTSALSYLKLPFLLAAGFVVVVVGLLLTVFRFKPNIGGVLGWLFGQRSPKTTSILVANTSPPKRQTPLGLPDKRGQVQAPVVPLDRFMNPLRDRSIVKLPDGQTVKLPEGVKDHQVDSVTHITTNVVAVKLADGPEKIKTTLTVDELLARYSTDKKGPSA